MQEPGIGMNTFFRVGYNGITTDLNMNNKNCVLDGSG